MARGISSSEEYEEIWKKIVNEVISCVLDDSPSDEILAHYLGKDIENNYRVYTKYIMY